MYCTICGHHNPPPATSCLQCGARIPPPGSSWSWFFGGTTLAFGVMLAFLLWGLFSTQAYRYLVGGLGPDLRALVPNAEGWARPLATPADVPAAAATPPPGIPGVPTSTSSPAPSPAAGAVAPTGSAPRMLSPGEVLSSGPWKLAVDSVQMDLGVNGRRVLVELRIKNDGDRSDVLSIPSALGASRPRLAGLLDGAPRWLLTQLADPAALRLRVVDGSDRPYDGTFVDASGVAGGSFTFVAAPGDAVRLSYAFAVDTGSVDPLSLDAAFGLGAGGERARIPLVSGVAARTTIAPSNRRKVARGGERIVVGGLWAFTVSGVQVGETATAGERRVTVQLEAENLSNQRLTVGGTENDPTGSARDFYLVDGSTRLAYSSGDSMPTTQLAPREKGKVAVQLRAQRDFATTGPYRFSIVLDPAANRYATFELP